MLIFPAKNYRRTFSEMILSDMEKLESKKGHLAALYFPFTYIQEELLKAVLFFFDRLVLYQPSEWQSSPIYPELVKADRLRLQVPIPAGANLPALKQKVRHLLSWGDFVFNSGQLGYLKYVGESRNAGEGYGEILAALRGEESAGPAFDDIAAIQLFLHLAQERDQREDEVSRLAHKLDMQEGKLWSELLQDGERLSQPAAIPATGGEGPISVATRLKVWSRLFEKGFSGAEIPLTDSLASVDLLPARESVLEINLPDFSGQDLPQVLEFREGSKISGALVAIKTYIRQLMERLYSSPWAPESVKDLETGRLQEALELLREGAGGGNLSPYRLTLFVFPGVSTPGMFSKGTLNEQNGFAFLLSKGGVHGSI